MDTKPFVYTSKTRGEIRGRIAPITNRSELTVTRYVRALLDGVPGLAEASVAERHSNPNMNHTSVAVWRFTNLARVVEIENLGFDIPGMFATKDEILAAWECYAADDPGFYQYLGDVIQGLDTPDAPLEARPEETLTAEQRNDPNSSGAATSTPTNATKRSKATSGAAKTRRKAASSTITTGTLSSASTSAGSPPTNSGK